MMKMKEPIVLLKILFILGIVLILLFSPEPEKEKSREIIFDDDISAYVDDAVDLKVKVNKTTEDNTVDENDQQKLRDVDLFILKHLLFIFFVGFACSPFYYESLGSYFGCGYFGAFVTYLCLILLDEHYNVSLASDFDNLSTFIMINFVFSVVGGFGGMLMYSLPMKWKTTINPFMYAIRKKLFYD